VGLFLVAGVLILPQPSSAKRVKIPANSAAAPDSLRYALEPYPYRIAPGDQLQVDYGLMLDRQSIVSDALVRPDGAVTLPHIGDVIMAGLSTQEADSILAERYADVYVNPSITVSVKSVAGNLVHVLGEVRNPGSYSMQPNATVLQMIAQAGGFQDDAQQGEVVVLRRNGPNDLVYRRLNMKDVFSNGIATADIMVRRYDIVFVNRSSIGNFRAFVEQAILPLTWVADAYLTGWTVFNVDRIYPLFLDSNVGPR
jgi:polysaccharide export outer membrane protein